MKDRDGNEIEIELDFDVILLDVGPNRMDIMRAVRALDPLNPMTPAQTKHALENLPFTVTSRTTQWDAGDIAGQLRRLGASAKAQLSKEQPTYEYYTGKKWLENDLSDR